MITFVQRSRKITSGFNLRDAASEGSFLKESKSRIAEICGSYNSLPARIYARLRFLILRKEFLDAMGQYLPRQGSILDVGCGFGLFSLYFAGEPGRNIQGFDLNPQRIAAAQSAARVLNLGNVTFSYDDARGFASKGPLDAAFMVDIIHHIPVASARDLLEKIAASIRPGGALIVKDIARRPAYKKWFTWILDKAMDFRAPVHYWEVAELRTELQRHFAQVDVQSMPDILPYPHVLYVCRK
ncbi:MAG: hypothetical protein DMG65_05560 [Candidatus Angelobacter sp. Gp1-AA117]|nr:MAG: hypothetical protein DMG65_05560 [Candidatus Angelobacter sp. Gp1-AA117]